MPRSPRQQSETGIYHFIVRGIDRMNIFRDDEDRQRYLDILRRFKQGNNYELYAYSLMTTHTHLLIKEMNQPLSHTAKKIGISYVSYFNKKYNRVGHLFQDRYKSEKINSDAYLLGCMRYIHNNAVKAGIVEDAGAYPYSSYNFYLGDVDHRNLVDSDFLLNYFASSKSKAINAFKQFSTRTDSTLYLDYDEEDVTQDSFEDKIKHILHKYCVDLKQLGSMEDTIKRDAILREIKSYVNAPVTEMSSYLQMSKFVIYRA